jgi:3-oxoacyl-[acyl-carrier-protein] synthase II
MTRTRVAITGVGVVNAAIAGGRDALHAWLGAPSVPSSVSGQEREPAGRAVPDDRLAQWIGADEARRMSRVCQLTVVAARLALADAGLAAGAALGLVVGTEFGDLRSTAAFADGFLSRGPTGLSPLLFPNTVMNTMASAAAIAVQARDASLTFAAPTVAGELAVARAAAGVAAGRLETVLAGGVDQIDGLVQSVVRTQTDRADTHGEGATFLVLEPWEAAVGRGARVLGEVLGVGWRSLPARSCGVGRGKEPRAIDAALADAGIAATDVRCVYGSASGDRARDLWEAALLAQRFSVESTALALAIGRHAGLGALHVAAAAWSSASQTLPSVRPAGAGARIPETGVARVERGPGLVHGIARGGTHVALVVNGAAPA